jgi:hypothetical protein
MASHFAFHNFDDGFQNRLVSDEKLKVVCVRFASFAAYYRYISRRKKKPTISRSVFQWNLLQ